MSAPDSTGAEGTATRTAATDALLKQTLTAAHPNHATTDERDPHTITRRPRTRSFTK